MPDTQQQQQQQNQQQGGGAPQGTNQQPGPQNQQQGQQQQAPQSWDAVLETFPPDVKALYESHTGGLRSALQSERQQRGDLAKQIKDLAAKAEKGSESEQQLQAMGAQLETANLRADFFEQAVKPETGCTNPSLAFIAAREAGAIDQRGRVNWDALKTAYPELFQKRVPQANAGSGTQQPPPAGQSMNEFIRKAAGR